MKRNFIVLSGLFFILTATIIVFQSCEEKDPLVVQGNIEGTVTDFETRQPVSGVLVDIVSNSSTTFVKQSRQTGNDGKYSFKDLEEGNYKLSFSRSGYLVNNVDVKVTAGQTVSSDITMQPDKNIISVSPETLNFGEAETEKSVIVQNNGLQTVPYEATADRTWITLANKQGSIAPNTSRIIQVTVQRAGLTPGDYTANIVINSNNTSVTVPVMLQMVAPSAPTVQIGQPTGITSTTAQVSGVIVSLGSSAVTEHGHCWSITPNPNTTNNKTTFGGTSEVKTFVSELTGLAANTTYYVKSYAMNNVGIIYSDQITFITNAPPTVPTVQTVRTENLKYNSIDGVGNITNLGDGLVTEHGFCYSRTNPEPTVNDSKISAGQTSQVGNFTVTMTGLVESTKYFVRAYAVNSRGTVYGTVLEAITSEAPPLVTSGLVAYYNFNDENCNESQGKTEYNGLSQGSGEAIWSSDIPGSRGKALQLSGDSYFLMNTSPFQNISTNYTINVWIKSMTTSQSLLLYVSGNGPSARINGGYVHPEATGNVRFNLDVTAFLLDGQWHMLTITRASGVCRLYIDGKSYATVNSTVTNTGVLHFGRGFTGIMDNFRLYNRAISQSEIDQIFEAKQ